MRAKKGFARTRAKKRLFKKVEGFVGGEMRTGPAVVGGDQRVEIHF